MLHKTKNWRLTKEAHSMKKVIALALALVCIFSLISCGNQSAEPINTIEGNMKTYYEMSDGAWQVDGHTYKYRLELKGTMPNAAASTTFVYLSNIESITYEQAWKASGLSSNTEDYFSVEEAVLVERKTE
jgi:uncharacterized lipoprotein YehR (DUF1307 family)